MRTIKVKYPGECRKCGATIPASADAVYEKHVGLFCQTCEPKDPEEIRTYRQEAATRRADRYGEWAAKRKEKAAAVFKQGEPFRSDIAFNTQPGHIPFRKRLIDREDRAFESLEVARRMEAKAGSLRNVRVAGDAEQARKARRERIRPTLKIGMLVETYIYGCCRIRKINRKTVTVEKDGHIYADPVDMSWIKIIERPEGVSDE